MTAEEIQCVYCGAVATEWDHLRPLVKGQRPTGFCSEIANLVPACGKCNQSKGASDWRSWMFGEARLSPATRRILDIEARARRIEAFARWREPRLIDFEKSVAAELWNEHWRNHVALLKTLQECQIVADRIRSAVEASARSNVI